VTPLAIGVSGNWRKLLDGKSGITRLLPEHLPEEHAHVIDQLPSQVVGVVDSHALAAAKKAVLGAHAVGMSRQEHFAEIAAAEVYHSKDVHLAT
jgi:hypothetical protein